MDVPLVGSIFIWSLPWAPKGYLLCDGASVNISQYEQLYSLIGHTYGGNGTTTFKLPDLRGRFPRGVNNSSYEPGRIGGQETVKLTTNNVPGHTHPATFTPTTTIDTITIPSVRGSGAITASASIDVTPGNAGTLPANGTNTYYLTGGKIGNNNVGGFTTTAPSAGNTAGVTGIKVAVDSHAYHPYIPEQQVSTVMVTGGDVLVHPNNNDNNNPIDPFNIVPPYLELNFIIAYLGLSPTRPPA